jgi:hypothetical protein
MVQLLLEFNADPEMMDLGNMRPLHRYVFRGNIQAMRAVLILVFSKEVTASTPEYGEKPTASRQSSSGQPQGT